MKYARNVHFKISRIRSISNEYKEQQDPRKLRLVV